MYGRPKIPGGLGGQSIVHENARKWTTERGDEWMEALHGGIGWERIPKGNREDFLRRLNSVWE